jgi:hypothetical protein
VKKPKELTAVRLDPADRRRIKAFSARLGVNESELIRYAIKRVVQDFGPLSDQGLEGAELMEPFLGHGPDMARWLDLTEAKLDSILHKDLQDKSLRVSSEDVRMTLTGNPTQGYAEWLAPIIQGKSKASATALTPSKYLYDKYVSPLRIEEMVEEQARLAARDGA